MQKFFSTALNTFCFWGYKEQEVSSDVLSFIFYLGCAVRFAISSIGYGAAVYNLYASNAGILLIFRENNLDIANKIIEQGII